MKIWPIVFCVALAGCATQPKLWSHPAKTTDDFYADRAQCMSMAGYGVASPQVVRPPSAPGFGGGFMSGFNMGAAINQAEAQQRILNDCMMGFGWRLSSNEVPQQDPPQGMRTARNGFDTLSDGAMP